MVAITACLYFSVSIPVALSVSALPSFYFLAS